MENEPRRHVVRIDRAELAGLGGDLAPAARGRWLRQLLCGKGIDPDRLYLVEYYPAHHCWLLTQDEGPRSDPPPSGDRADTLFYVRVMTEFQQVARSACRALAANSPHFARFGRKFQPPEPARELPLSDLVDQLGGGGDATTSVRFDSEGRWHSESQG
jgi:hypothetical protein